MPTRRAPPRLPARSARTTRRTRPPGPAAPGRMLCWSRRRIPVTSGLVSNAEVTGVRTRRFRRLTPAGARPLGARSRSVPGEREHRPAARRDVGTPAMSAPSRARPGSSTTAATRQARPHCPPALNREGTRPMSLVVQKFGGSSVADADSIKRVAKRISLYAKAGHKVVVVVSAMGDTTDDLIDLAEQVSENPPERELDMLVTAVARISMAVLSMALNDAGVDARAYTGSQAGLITDEVHGKAPILRVTPGSIEEALDGGPVAIDAGLQGVPDAAAVALAAAREADVCEIYPDVDGVFSADPRIATAARRVPLISSEEMLEMAANGSKILMARSVEYARRYGVPLHVRSSYSVRLGTLGAEDPAQQLPTEPDVSLRSADV